MTPGDIDRASPSFLLGRLLFAATDAAEKLRSGRYTAGEVADSLDAVRNDIGRVLADRDRRVELAALMRKETP